MQVPDNGFSVLTAANALTQSSRLDYQLDLQASTTYRFWVRMRAPIASGAVAPVLGTHTAPTATLAPTSDASTAVGDLVIVTTWSATTANGGVPTHTLQTGFTEILTRQLNGNNGDADDSNLSVAYRVATVAGAQTYQAYASSGGTSLSAITVIKAGTYDLTSIPSASTAVQGSNPPDPPADGNATGPSVALAIGAWTQTAATVTVTAPAGYTKLWDLAGSSIGELSMASLTVGAGTAVNPGAFGDNVAPKGTAAATIVINGFAPASKSVWAGLNQGTTAGAANGTALTIGAPNQWQWIVSPALSTTTAGTYTFSLYTREDGLIVDTVAVSRQGTVSPTFEDSWAYQMNPRTVQPQTCNDDEFDTDLVTAGDQDDIKLTGSMAACFANKAGAADAFDMSGNVKEWTLARAAGQNPLRGGASNSPAQGTSCTLNFTLANDAFFFPNTGFRCCR